MKYIVAFILALSLTSCGWFDRKKSSFTGGASKTCIDSVTYLQFTSGATVQVDTDGRPVPCKE